VSSIWERREPTVEANRFLVVRLDRAGSAAALDATALAKVARAARAALARGDRTRARITFVPAEGFLPPDEWPVGVPIQDESRLAIPRDLALGDYTVKIRVFEEAFYPNLRPEDLFSLSDSYDGVPIGTVRITQEERQTS
jgi:hypothetical protein